jgi:fibronectin-binding autotransporter adhesin
MKPKFIIPLSGSKTLPALVIFSCLCGHALAATIKKANNNTDLNVGTSWIGGVVPGLGDIALWEGTVTGVNTTSIGANTIWQGIKISTTAGGGGNVGGTVTINGASTLTIGAANNDIDLGTGTMSLNLNTPVVFNGANTWNVAAERTLNLSNSISGDFALIKAGAGIANTTGAGSYTGGTTINGTGALVFRTTTALPTTGAVTVAAGATFGIGVASTGTYFTSADIDALYSGTFTTAAVTLNATSNVGIDTTQGNFTHATSIPASTQGLNKLGINTLTLSGTNAYTGNTIVTTGSLIIQNDQSAATGSIIIGDNTFPASSLTIDAGAQVAVAADKLIKIGRTTVSGTGATMNVAGSVNNLGALVIGRPGVLNVNTGGTWSQTGDMALQGQGNGAVTANIQEGATFTNLGTNPTTIETGSGGFTGVVGLNIFGTYLTGVGFTGTQASTGSGLPRVAIIGGTLKLTAPITNLFAGTQQIRCTLTNSAKIDTGTHEVSINNSIDGAGSLTKLGSSTLTLAGNNAYTGNTIISEGAITLTGTGSIQSSALVSISSGATLNVLAEGYPVAAARTLAGEGTVTGGAVNVLSLGSIAPGNNGVGTLTVNALTMNSGSLLKMEIPTSGANDLIAVSATDGLILNGGVISLFEPGTTTGLTQNGTYNLIQYSGTLGGSGLNSLTIRNPQPGKAYAFDSSGGFVRVTISSGATLGYWNVDGDGSWGTLSNWSSPSIPNSDGASAYFGGGGTPTSAPRTVLLDGNWTIGNLGFNSSSSFTLESGTPAESALTLLSSLFIPTITTVLGSHVVNVPMTVSATEVSVDVQNTATLALNGAISGSATLRKIGTGNLIIGGANTYSVGTSIDAGTLTLSGAGTLGNSSAALGVGNATLDLGTTNQTIGALTLNGGTIQNGTLNANNYDGLASGSISAILAGSISLNKSSPGILNLSGVNTYQGGTTLTAGTLVVSDDTNFGAIPDSPTPANLVLNGGLLTPSTSFTLNANRGIATGPNTGTGNGAISVTGTNILTIQGIIANQDGGIGGLTINAASTDTGGLILSGANTYTGGATISSGTLTLQNDQSAANGGIVVGPLNAALTTLNIPTGAKVAVASGKTFRLGNIAANGTATLSSVATVAGEVVNDGSLHVGRVGALTLSSGGTWAQNGDMTVQAYGNLSANLTVANGGTLTYAGTNTVKLNGAGASFNTKATLTVNGTLITSKGFEQTISLNSSATGYGQIALAAGTIRLSADVTDLVFGTAGGVRLGLTGLAKIDTNGFSTTINQVITGGGSLNKLGEGKLTLTGVNTYSGDTNVNVGTLAIAGNSIADAGKVSIADNAKIEVSGTETIGTLFFAGVQQAAGTWGATDSGATNIDDVHFSGTGVVSVTTGPITAGYASWAAGFTAPALSDPAATADPDSDGIPNAIEFVVGGDPRVSSQTGRPTSSDNGTILTFQFNREDSSELGDTLVNVETSTDLVTWTETYTIGTVSAGDVTIQENDTAPDLVTVAIPHGANTTLFARLKVSVP